jgi:hypothetical protein
VTSAQMPSFLHGCIARNSPPPRLELVQAWQSDDEESRQFQKTMAFVLGMEDGAERKGILFRGVFMDLLMPAWDPLRKRGVVELPLEGGE